jgi:periplasmic copper chaperone A
MRAFVLFLLFAAWLGSTTVTAHDVTFQGLVIGHPWVRATPPGANAAAAYVTIRNAGNSPDTLLGATAEFANRAELHENLTTADGIMQMRLLPEGIVIAPGATIALAPGGKHLMFLGLGKPLRPDLLYAGTLNFAKAGAAPIEFFVEPIGTKKPLPH